MPILASNGVSVPANSGPTWREALRLAIRDPGELCRQLDLPEGYAERARRAAESFDLFAPREFVARMRPGDVDDPLLRQVLPLAEELQPAAGFLADPVGDGPATAAPGLLHKYAGRALLMVTGACAVHCRYCFRRHFPYGEGPRSIDEFQPALDRLADDTSIQEVLLSGGDPWSCNDQRLAELVGRLERIGHLRRLRVHTRLPIVIPQRVDADLLEWLERTRLTTIVVVHANHAAELDQPVCAAFDRLRGAGAVVLNQSVLLRGVNDSADALIALSERLVDNGVMPYYLHQLDRVHGAAHFEVPIARGLQMIEQIRRQLPGYAVPRYVAERPGEPAKHVLA